MYEEKTFVFVNKITNEYRIVSAIDEQQARSRLADTLVKDRTTSKNDLYKHWKLYE